VQQAQERAAPVIVAPRTIHPNAAPTPPWNPTGPSRPAARPVDQVHAASMMRALREVLDANPSTQGITELVQELNSHAADLGPDLCDDMVRMCVRYVSSRAHTPEAIPERAPARAIIFTEIPSGALDVFIRVSHSIAAPRGQSFTTEVITRPGSRFRSILPFGHQDPTRAVLASASLDGTERICHMAIQAACRVSRDAFDSDHRARICLVHHLPGNAVIFTETGRQLVVGHWWDSLIVDLRNQYQVGR
jgi:hypothetical protein